MSMQTSLGGSERWMAVEQYLESLYAASDTDAQATKAAQQAAGMPDIEVSAMHARLLGILAASIGAETAVEFGTLGGFSTLHIARALPPHGRIITHELEAAHAAVARESLEKAGVGHKVTIREGVALENLPLLADDAPIDFAFVDADKPSNTAYVQACLAVARPGALIVVDNVIRDGDVADPANDDEKVAGSREVLEYVAREERLDATVLQTVGRKYYDGLLIARVL